MNFIHTSFLFMAFGFAGSYSNLIGMEFKKPGQCALCDQAISDGPVCEGVCEDQMPFLCEHKCHYMCLQGQLVHTKGSVTCLYCQAPLVDVYLRNAIAKCDDVNFEETLKLFCSRIGWDQDVFKKEINSFDQRLFERVPLLDAAEFGTARALFSLICLGSDVRMRGQKTGKTALHYVFAREPEESDDQANQNRVDYVLMALHGNDQKSDISKDLSLRIGKRWESRDKDTPLDYAVAAGNLYAVKALIAHGLKYNLEVAERLYPLRVLTNTITRPSSSKEIFDVVLAWIATELGQEQMDKYLNTRDDNGHTVLFYVFDLRKKMVQEQINLQKKINEKFDYVFEQLKKYGASVVE